MARFAQFYIKYTHDLGPYGWESRQQHLAHLFETDNSIDFVQGEGDARKIYNHRVYHLQTAPDIIVMQLANSIDIPIEKHYEPSVAKNEPSCFVVIDNRRGLRTVAIHCRKKAFSTPQQVARILSRTIHARLNKDYCYSFDLLPDYYPADLFKTWERLQQHTQNIIFGTPEALSEEEIMQCVERLKNERKDYFDDSFMPHVLFMAMEAKKCKYKSIFTVMPEAAKTALYVDKSTVYMKNLLTLSRATNTPVELVTNDGAHYTCLIDSEETVSDKIVSREFDEVLLECLFRNSDREGNPLELPKRIEMETKVIELMNGIKHAAEDVEVQTA